MRLAAVFGALALTLATGCAATTTLTHQRASVRSLKVIGLGQVETKDVVVLLDPITASNWREQPDVTTTVLFEQNDLSMMPIEIGSSEGGTSSHGFGGSVHSSATARTTGRTPVEDVLSLVPLPAFRVEVINRSTQPITLDPSQWTISDGRGASAHLLDDEAFRKEAERVISASAIATCTKPASRRC